MVIGENRGMVRNEPVKLLELLADGGSVTVVGRNDGDQWEYAVVVDESALEDEGGGCTETPLDSWDDVLDALERYRWRKLGLGFVHPAFAERIHAARRREPRGTLAAARVKRTFERAGLAVPPIPERFKRSLRVLDGWCFATRKIDGFSMYSFDGLISEALCGHAPDYVAISHAGHGVNSYAVSYFLVDGPLVLLTQAPWGGVYMEADSAASGVKALFDRCSELIDAISQAPGPLQAGRLVVVDSTMRGMNAWGWVSGPLPDKSVADEWVETHSARGAATGAALEWLRNGARQEQLF
jgi:hypothetical protein